MGIDQVAAIVTSCRTAEVLALVGSFSYSERYQGFNNGALADRSAGSTLKPFLYALALEKGYGGSSEISDTDRVYQTPHGDYLPMNADRREDGPVNVRSALGNSLNVSAVKVVRWVGLEDFYRLLDRVEVITQSSAPPEHYGLGLAVGNVEVSLYRLVQAYLALANQGVFRPLRVETAPEESASSVVSPEVAYVITHILADPSARLLSFGNPGYFDFGFPVAVKTGTSSNYRDAWVMGTRSGTSLACGLGTSTAGRARHDGRGGVRTYAVGSHAVPLRSYASGGVREALGVQRRRSAPCPGGTRLRDVPTPPRNSSRAGTRSRVCDLPHEGEHHHLGSSYARWLHRREALQGVSRFRLMQPDNAPAAGWR